MPAARKPDSNVYGTPPTTTAATATSAAAPPATDPAPRQPAPPAPGTAQQPPAHPPATARPPAVTPPPTSPTTSRSSTTTYPSAASRPPVSAYPTVAGRPPATYPPATSQQAPPARPGVYGRPSPETGTPVGTPTGTSAGTTTPAHSGATAGTQGGSTAPADGDTAKPTHGGDATPADSGTAMPAPSSTTATTYGGTATPSPSGTTATTYGSAATPAPSGTTATTYGSAATPAPSGTTATTYGGTAAATPAGSGQRAPRRPRRALVLVLAVVLILALLGIGGTVQLTRDLPAATLTAQIAPTLRIPGRAPVLPWPDRGAAELMIEGLGRLGGSGAKTPAPIGSVAKVMTAYVILRDHPLTGDEEGPTLTITAADVADYQSRIATNQSQVPITVGERLTQRDAIEALMLPSANNIAHKLAVWDAGSEAAFLDKMNAAAADLGMTATRYSDPSGFLPTTTSTAADQVTLARAVLKSEVFAEIVALPSATIPVAGRIRNYNDLLGELGVFGIKTGSTDEAGGNLVFAARLTVGGRRLTVVGAVFNQPGLNTPEQLAQVNREVRALLRAVRDVVKQYTLLAADPVGEVATAWGDRATVRPAKPLQVVGWPGLAVPVQVTTAAPGATVAAGEVVGAVQASGVRVDLRADAATGDPSLWWRLTRTS